MIPSEAFIFPLRDNSKEPKTPHGHLNSIKAPRGRPRGNYGISLDRPHSQYIVVDIDTDHPERHLLEDNLPQTWEQKTSRTDADGRHFLYKVPIGYVGSGKRNWNGTDGKKIADIKAKGYIVGPGSVVNDNEYKMINKVEPVDAPKWLLDFCYVENQEIVPSEEQDGIPNGDHDSFLASLAGFLRGRHALSEPTIQRVLRNGPLFALQGVDSTRPYQDSDLARIARSAARYEAEKDEVISLSPEGWQTALDIDTSLPLKDWILYNYIPEGELCLIYGKGGIGKSTLASWVCAQALSKGKAVGFCGVEEPFARFAVRTRMSGPTIPVEEFSRLVNIGNLWKFPEDGDRLRNALEQYRLDVLYFDSIYSHFGDVQGHEGVRARLCLSPLAAIAQEMGITVIGTFHENKAGALMGSSEMENVCRVLLHATRPKGRVFRLNVAKTNFTEPAYDLQFNSESRPALSFGGDPWMEKNEEGVIVPVNLHIMTDTLKVNFEDTDEDMPTQNLVSDQYFT